MEHVLLFFLGLFVGTFGTLVGVGGGFIIVPMLLFVYHASPTMAVGTSLCVIAFNAVSGSFSYARQRRIDYRTGAIFALSTVPGAILGASLLDKIPAAVFDVSFAIFLLCVAVYIFLKPDTSKKTGGKSEEHSFDPSRRVSFNLPLGIVVSFLVGFLSSMAGIGGGIVHVPAMIYIFNFPPFIAVATSHFILAISSLVGSGSHAMLGHVMWHQLPGLAVGAVVGAQVGARISKKVKSVLVMRGLAVAVVIVAMRLLFKHW
ncbi:MAG: sulfite exporter TauE/SafE family protein [Ignavibacteriales bacterium]|nr:sulfite exporter TauE/SafE family protein [Ignavibacteriales bacterium]